MAALFACFRGYWRSRLVAAPTRPSAFRTRPRVRARSTPRPIETRCVFSCWSTPRATEPDWRDAGFLVASEDARALLRALSGRGAARSGARRTPRTPSGQDRRTRGRRTTARLSPARQPEIGASPSTSGHGVCGRVRAGRISPLRLPRITEPSRFPPIERDLALRGRTGCACEPRSRRPRAKRRRRAVRRTRLRRISRSANRRGA